MPKQSPRSKLTLALKKATLLVRDLKLANLKTQRPNRTGCRQFEPYLTAGCVCTAAPLAWDAIPEKSWGNRLRIQAFRCSQCRGATIGRMAESMRNKTFVHKHTPQGIKLLSSATTKKAAEAGISRTFNGHVGRPPDPVPGAVRRGPVNKATANKRLQLSSNCIFLHI